MYAKLQRLFGNHYPSVNKFLEKLNELTQPEEKKEYKELVYRIALYKPPEINQKYRLFVGRFIQRNRNEFFIFIWENTLLIDLRYELKNPELLLKFLELKEIREKNPSSSILDLTLSLMLVFNYGNNLRKTYDQLRNARFTTEELLDMKGKAPITNVHDE